jgi:hypothetical protein
MLILIGFSGCLASLSDRVVEIDTQSTTQFFSTQIGLYGSNPRALNILRSLLESLQAYQLPAEVALQSIDKAKKHKINKQYNDLIRTINDHLSAPSLPAATGEPRSVTNLCKDIITWTKDVFSLLIQTPPPEKYVLQKLLVVMFGVSRIEEVGGSRDLQEESEAFLEMLIAYVDDIDRLVLCEAMMLSAMIESTVSNMHDTSVRTNIQLKLKIETMWGESLVENGTKKKAIISFIENLIEPMVSNDMPPQNPSVKLQKDFREGFIYGTIRLVDSAHRFGMSSQNRKHVLTWAKGVWDWYFQRYDSLEKRSNEEMIEYAIDAKIRSWDSGAGPSSSSQN